LETTGLNIRESFLQTALPLGQMITIKLKASRKILYQRIQQKNKIEQGGNWLYSGQYRDKHEFVRKLFKCFQMVPSDCCIDTNNRDKAEVYRIALEKINLAVENPVWSEIFQTAQKHVRKIRLEEKDVSVAIAKYSKKN
jgi:hypothetical protein